MSQLERAWLAAVQAQQGQRAQELRDLEAARATSAQAEAGLAPIRPHNVRGSAAAPVLYVPDVAGQSPLTDLEVARAARRASLGTYAPYHAPVAPGIPRIDVAPAPAGAGGVDWVPTLGPASPLQSPLAPRAAQLEQLRAADGFVALAVPAAVPAHQQLHHLAQPSEHSPVITAPSSSAGTPMAVPATSTAQPRHARHAPAPILIESAGSPEIGPTVAHIPAANPSPRAGGPPHIHAAAAQLSTLAAQMASPLSKPKRAPPVTPRDATAPALSQPPQVAVQQHQPHPGLAAPTVRLSSAPVADAASPPIAPASASLQHVTPKQAPPAESTQLAGEALPPSADTSRPSTAASSPRTASDAAHSSSERRDLAIAEPSSYAAQPAVPEQPRTSAVAPAAPAAAAAATPAAPAVPALEPTQQPEPALAENQAPAAPLREPPRLSTAAPQAAPSAPVSELLLRMARPRASTAPAPGISAHTAHAATPDQLDLQQHDTGLELPDGDACASLPSPTGSHAASWAAASQYSSSSDDEDVAAGMPDQAGAAQDLLMQTLQPMSSPEQLKLATARTAAQRAHRRRSMSDALRSPGSVSTSSSASSRRKARALLYGVPLSGSPLRPAAQPPMTRPQPDFVLAAAPQPAPPANPTAARLRARLGLNPEPPSAAGASAPAAPPGHQLHAGSQPAAATTQRATPARDDTDIDALLASMTMDFGDGDSVGPGADSADAELAALLEKRWHALASRDV